MTDIPVAKTIAILGGTGKEGKGLAYRWARAGYRIIIGSRMAEKAQETANEIFGQLDRKASISGATNLEAARNADWVVLTVPFPVHREILESVKDGLQGKILIDVTVPLVPPKITIVQMPPAGSAAQEARQILGPGVEVAAAFQNISHKILQENEAVDCDVLVTGTSREARAETLKLVMAAGFTGWDAGPIENSMVVEGMTSLLLHINKQYGSTHAGIKITGIERT